MVYLINIGVLILTIILVVVVKHNFLKEKWLNFTVGTIFIFIFVVINIPMPLRTKNLISIILYGAISALSLPTKKFTCFLKHKFFRGRKIR